MVGKGTKIDNLVHVGHNDIIGENCILVAHVGISGSVTIGDNCTFGGQAATAGHLKIGRGCTAGRTGIISDVPDGVVWAGFPAQPHVDWLRQVANERKLGGLRGCASWKRPWKNWKARRRSKPMKKQLTAALLCALSCLPLAAEAKVTPSGTSGVINAPSGYVRLPGHVSGGLTDQGRAECTGNIAPAPGHRNSGSHVDTKHDGLLWHRQCQTSGTA